MFTPITEARQVPLVGAGYETPFFDLKGHPDAYKGFIKGKRVWRRYELAKDVAAFANGYGGTILLGATEDRATGTCSGHNPFTPDVATEFEVALKDALEKRCRPRPFVQVDRIAFAEKVMVAVNVWAFPGQAIAVQVLADKSDGFGDRAYVFPVRLLSHADYLTPEQLPMLMTPDVRRAAILLSTLKVGDTIQIHPKMVIDSDQHVRPFQVTFVRLEEMKNCLIVGVEGQREAGIPLDDVSVWYEGERCHVRCDRRLVVRS